MDRHFEDSRYYLKRAVQTTRKGVTAEAEPVKSKVRELTGQESEPEPTRFESMRARAEGEVRAVVSSVREVVGSVRGRTCGAQ